MSSPIVLHAVGYWDSDLDQPRLIHPVLLVTPTWELQTRRQIVSYLRAAPIFQSWLGYHTCLFPGPTPKEMGVSDLTDGYWVWPEGLAVYVERFNVRLPDQFMHHMSHRGFDPKPDRDRWGCLGRMARLRNPEFEVVQSVETNVDYSFWKEWCASERERAKREEE